jgi:hypothetical protein
VSLDALDSSPGPFRSGDVQAAPGKLAAATLAPVRLGFAVASASLILLAVPGIASAHVRIGRLAVDVRVRVIRPRPSAQGPFALSVSDGDHALHLAVRSGHRVVVLGYLGEPVLRVDARGLAVNLGSPTAAAAGLVPKRDRASRVRGWSVEPGEHTAVWRDPRVKQLPTGMKRAAWSIPIVVDGRRARIVGALVRVSRPILWPWVLLVLGVGSLGALVAIANRRRRLRASCAVLGAVAAVAGIVAAAGFAFAGGASGMRVAVVYELLLAAGGAGFAIWGPHEVRAVAAGWLGLLGLIGGLVCAQVFVHGAVLSVLPATLTRTAAALAIGSGAAALLLTGLVYAPLPDFVSSPS